jgi:Flp pilus assembly protein TadG
MRCSRARVTGERGTVTAELAACLPVLVLVLAVVLSAVSVSAARVRVQDAAREAARAAARGDDVAARRLAQEYAPGCTVTITRSASQVVALARMRAHLFADWLPAIAVGERAVAAVEPSDAPRPAVPP